MKYACVNPRVMNLGRYYSTIVQLPKRRGELIYGLAPCLAALQARRRKIYSIFKQDGFEGGNNRKRQLKELLTSKIQLQVKKKDSNLLILSNADITRLVGKKPHQGIVLDAEPLSFRTSQLTNLLKNYSKQCTGCPLWLVLYQIQDPMNFGAILRCAYFLGVEKVLVSSKNSCGLTPVVSKASAGAMELLHVHSIQNVATTLEEARSSGWTVLGASSVPSNLAGSPPVTYCGNMKINSPTLLVLGNEGHGLPKDITNGCTSIITIPPQKSLPPGFDSLNVSVAAGILLHSLIA